MPPLTRLFIKTSLIWLGLSLFTGIALAANAVWDLPALFGVLGPVFFHLFLVGWVTQLIFGVVYWMFPKYSQEKPRGQEGVAWAIFWLLNSGLALRAVGEPWQALQPGALGGWTLAVSALLQWVAGLLFVVITWGRVKER
jgi:cbb3-type cytochrome oxidase subunit 1